MLKKITSFFTDRPQPAAAVVDLNYRDIVAGRAKTFDLLRNGAVIIVRQIAPIIAGRAEMIRRASELGATTTELMAFYESGRTPSLETISALSGAIKFFRSHRRWSIRLHEFATALRLPGPVLYDGGIPRLVLPDAVVGQARASGAFDPTDFKRRDPAAATEIFMPAPANIHRDFNRQHHLFQLNIWWPLHDCGEDEVLRIYPELYHKPLFDRPAEEAASLGPHMRYRLAFGDAIMFHGEHLHTSPVGVPGGRRQSVDFRVASACADDNAHYRSGYLNANNFASEPVITRIVQMETAPDTLAAPWFDATLSAFNAAPSFAEDRYLLLHKTAKPVNPAAATAALEEIIVKSDQHFWLMKAGQQAAADGHPALAEQAATRLLTLPTTPPPDFMPVAYVNQATQVMPEAAQAWAREVTLTDF